MTADVLPLRPRSAPLVGLIGKKRSGKDTFASALVEEFGFTRVAFADPLKEAALIANPLVCSKWAVLELDHDEITDDFVRLSTVVEARGWEEAKEIPEVRRTLQNFGIGIREIDPGFWVRAAMQKAASIAGPVVVTDVRFPNEATAITAAGGKLVRVTRPGENLDEHVSETALDDWIADHNVPNLSTIDALKRNARILAPLL